MLSQELDIFAERLRGWAGKGGVELAPYACHLLADQLRMLAQDARRMEAGEVPPGLCLPEDPGPGVVKVDFAGARWQRDMRRYALQGGPIQGGVA